MPQQPVIALFNQRFAARKQPPSSPFSKGELKEADTSAIERQIDEMVWADTWALPLQGLTCLQATHRQTQEEIMFCGEEKS